MQSKLTLGIFSASHLVVDFSCFYVLMGSFTLDTGDLQLISLGFLLYNLIAFALQIFIGILADKSSIAHGYFAVAGCLLVLLGVIVPASAWARLAICALGNALFHIGGGIDSLVHANGRYARSGFFIAFGALGVALGTLSGRGGLMPSGVVALLLAACTALILLFCRQAKRPYQAAFDFPPARISLPGIVIGLCLLSIIVRAAVGSYTPLFERSTTLLFVLPATSVFVGKLAGGFLADRFGARAIATISLVLSAPLLAFANTQIILCCLGLVLFNVTTAVTLCVITSHLPQAPGFSFGLTTLALFIGSSFSFFLAMPQSLRPLLTITLIAVSAICILLSAPGKQASRR